MTGDEYELISFVLKFSQALFKFHSSLTLFTFFDTIQKVLGMSSLQANGPSQSTLPGMKIISTKLLNALRNVSLLFSKLKFI